MTGASRALSHIAAMTRGGSKLRKVGKVKQLVRRVSSAGKIAFKKGRVASKVAKKNRELMTPMGQFRIGESRAFATERNFFKLGKKGKPSFDSLHRLRRLGVNAALGAEAKASGRRVGTGLALGAVGVGGYKLGKKKKSK